MLSDQSNVIVFHSFLVLLFSPKAVPGFLCHAFEPRSRIVNKFC